MCIDKKHKKNQLVIQLYNKNTNIILIQWLRQLYNNILKASRILLSTNHL